MTATLVDFAHGSGGSGTPRQATATLVGLSASNCTIIVAVSSRATTFSGFDVTDVTWDGTPMVPVVAESAALNGFGKGLARFFQLAIGTVSGLTASAVATANSSNSDIALEITVSAWSPSDQGTPVNLTAGSNVISGSSSITETVGSDPSDHVLGCVCFAENSAVSAAPTSGQTKISAENPSFGATMSHVVGHDVADGGANTSGNWGSFSSSWAYCMASFVEGVAAIPTILNVNGGSFADPDEVNVKVNGVTMDPGGVTQLVYADSAVYATANKVIQTISGVTSTQLNWDFITLGVVGAGDNFLYVVTDAGGGGEAVSDPFPILVDDATIEATRTIYLTDGTLGPVLVVPTSFDNAKFAIIRGNSNTSPDTVQADAVLTYCIVDLTTGMGMAIGSSSGPDSHQREQVQGPGSLFLVDGGSGAHIVEGTPSLGSDGLTIDFTINTAGYNLEISVIGGDGVLANLLQVDISDSPYTGLGYRPDLLIGTTVGIPDATPGDNSFALMAFGIAIDQGVLQQFMLATTQSDSTRTSVLKDGSFLSQISGTGFDWEMAITSFDADGFSWSGSNTDGSHILAVRLPGRKLFMDVFNKDDVVPGTEQDLPDIGFAPGFIGLLTAGKNVQTPTPALGARWSLGFASDSGQDVSQAQCLPETGTMTAEQFESFSNVVAVSSLSGQITALGQLITFGQVSTIEWVTSLAGNTMAIGMFAMDLTDLDEEDDFVIDEPT